MYYHRLPKLGKLLQGKLASKLRKGPASKDFIDRECNCNSTKKVNGICEYRYECRICCVVYKVTCKCCGEFYIGDTQNTLNKEWSNTSNMFLQKS